MADDNRRTVAELDEAIALVGTMKADAERAMRKPSSSTELARATQTRMGGALAALNLLRWMRGDPEDTRFSDMLEECRRKIAKSSAPKAPGVPSKRTAKPLGGRVIWRL